MLRRLGFGFLAGIALLAVAVVTRSPAHAQGASDAKKLYEEGLAHYNLAEYDEAIAVWKEAYRLSKKPLLLFNVGQAYRLKGDCPQALRFYQNYLREVATPSNRSEVDAAMEMCRSAPAPATPAPPATTPASEPAPRPEVVQPPPAATAPGAETPGPAAGEDVLAPRDEPAASAEPARGGGRGKKIAGLVTAGAGVLLAGTGVYFQLGAANDAESLGNYSGDWTAEQESLEGRMEQRQLLAMTCFAVGGAAIVAGGVIYYLGVREARAPSVTAALLPGGGAAIGWSTSF